MWPDSQLRWAEFWAGPADGDCMPIDERDPIPRIPYRSLPDDHPQSVVCWYELHRHDDGRFLFVLSGAKAPAPWVPV